MQSGRSWLLPYGASIYHVRGRDGEGKMKSHTAAEDEGGTRRADGQRARKSDPLLEAVGTLDELSAQIGLCLTCAESTADEEVAAALCPVQGELFAVGAALSGAEGDPFSGGIQRLARLTDEAAAKLPPLGRFILPGGCELSGRLHVARTVCRRAERRAVAAADAYASVPPDVVKYLNRLGELLFVLARLANRHAGVPETKWGSKNA